MFGILIGFGMFVGVILCEIYGLASPRDAERVARDPADTEASDNVPSTVPDRDCKRDASRSIGEHDHALVSACQCGVVDGLTWPYVVRGTPVPPPDLILSIARTGDPIPYATVIDRQSKVTQPTESVWYHGTLSISKPDSVALTDRQRLTILFPKSAKQLESKRRRAKHEIQTHLQDKGLTDLVLLTTPAERDFLVIDGNHRASHVFLNEDRSLLIAKRIVLRPAQYSVFIGIVSSECWEKWSNWNHAPLVVPNPF